MSKEQISQRYELGERIGEDLISEEFEGQDRQGKRRVVVKLLKADERTQENALPVEPGDKIILFTDGVTEAPNEHDEQFGLGRLRLSVAKHGGKTLN